MSTTNENVASALNKHLSLMTPTMGIAWENVEYTPPAMGTPYLRSWHLPGETDTITLGPNAVNGYYGVYQIDCLYPIGKGWQDAKVKAGKVATWFKRGTLITYNTMEVRLIKAYPSPGTVDGGYYKISVSTEYESYEVT
jgi:hypothetical protein